MLAMVGKDYATSPTILGLINVGRVFANNHLLSIFFVGTRV